MRRTKAAFRSTIEILMAVAASAVTTLPHYQVHVAVVTTAKITKFLKPSSWMSTAANALPIFSVLTVKLRKFLAALMRVPSITCRMQR